MKSFKEFKESLSYIPPKMSHEDYNKRSSELKSYFEKKMKIKYSSVGTAYGNATEDGRSTHMLISAPLKSENNKIYGGAIAHTMNIELDKNGKVKKIDSIINAQKRAYGDWVNNENVYDYAKVKSLAAAVKHLNARKSNPDQMEYHKKMSKAILYPGLFK